MVAAYEGLTINFSGTSDAATANGHAANTNGNVRHGRTPAHEAAPTRA